MHLCIYAYAGAVSTTILVVLVVRSNRLAFQDKTLHFDWLTISTNQNTNMTLSDVFDWLQEDSAQRVYE